MLSVSCVTESILEACRVANNNLTIQSHLLTNTAMNSCVCKESNI